LGKKLAISYRLNFSPTLVNEFTAGFNRFAFQFTFGESNPNFPNPQKVPIWADDCVLGSTLNVDGPYCLSPHTQRAITTPQLVDNVTWIHGKHTLRAGLNFRFYIHNDSRGFFGGSVVEPIIRFNRSNRLAGFNNNPAPYDEKQTLVPNVFPDGSQGNVTYVKANRWFKNDNIGSVGPRIGIAWSPDQKTSVRAGYSWLFDTLSTFQVTAMAGKMPGF